MRRFRFYSALLGLALALGLSLAAGPDSSAAADGPRCNCLINDGEDRKYAVFYREENFCVVEDCWIDVE